MSDTPSKQRRLHSPPPQVQVQSPVDTQAGQVALCNDTPREQRRRRHSPPPQVQAHNPVDPQPVQMEISYDTPPKQRRLHLPPPQVQAQSPVDTQAGQVGISDTTRKQRRRRHSPPPQIQAQNPVDPQSEQIETSNNSPPKQRRRSKENIEWRRLVMDHVQSNDPDLKGQEKQSYTEISEKWAIRRADSIVPDILSVCEVSDKFDVFNDGASMTHLSSLFILNSQCFIVSAYKAVKNKKYISQLGVCVIARSPCTNSPPCKTCTACGVCPHMYKCQCQLKFRDSQWCEHIHKMHTLTQGKFLEAAFMFVHEKWNFTELYHLRAFIQGPTKMMEKAKKLLWQEQFESLNRQPRHKVMELPQAEFGPCFCSSEKCQLCEACICKYICTCTDNFVDYQICEHIHNVAMQKQQQGDEKLSLFEDFKGFEGDSEYLLPPEKDFYSQFYIEQEHQMGFYFDRKHVTRMSEKEWHFKRQEISGEILEMAVVTKQLSTVPSKNCCPRCQISDKDYTCSCPYIKYRICRHIHALIQLTKDTPETPEEMQNHIINSILQNEEPRVNIRQPLGLVEGGPEVTFEELTQIFGNLGIDNASRQL